MLAFFALPAFPQGATPIHAIQGVGVRSPLEGQVVTTAGVVTAVRASSFYIQSPPEWADADPRTSEGLLIFLGAAPPAAVTPGALVQVRGTVTEFVSAADVGAPPLTELTRPIEITPLEGQTDLPAPVELTRALLLSPAGIAALEPYEGMRVTTKRVIVTAPSANNGVFFGVLPGFARPIRTADWDGSPEKLRLDSNRVAPVVAAGARLNDLTGVLDFGQRAWTLVITSMGQVEPSPYWRTPIIPPAAGELSIANLNCERFFDTVDDPGVSDTVLSDADYSARRTKLVRFILTTLHSPDVIALQEIENLRVLEEIAENVNSVARENGLPVPDYRAYLEEGTDPGGIDTGFLVKRARVQVIDVFQWGRQDTYIRPDGRIETLNERPPLALYAKAENRDFIVIANHFRSMTDVEDPVSGPRIRLKRRLQAEQLRDLVARLTADNPGTPLAAVGDFNAFAFPNLPDDDPLAALRGPLELLSARIPPAQAVSYTFQGAGQTIDHVFANRAFAANLSRLAYTAINTSTP
ncbi:MAG: endonuclease/exonuclease/phosphatase family protein, partial [Bryobacter sp.]|nr:endonuclease/exonuclease/phosphatase family protein [Bryobacter sp.]